jgi:hypothetical protein
VGESAKEASVRDGLPRVETAAQTEPPFRPTRGGVRFDGVLQIFSYGYGIAKQSGKGVVRCSVAETLPLAEPRVLSAEWPYDYARQIVQTPNPLYGYQGPCL